MMDAINNVVTTVNGVVWGWPMIILLLGTHVFMTDVYKRQVFIYNNSEIDRIERDFQQTLAKCHKVTLIEVRKRTMLTKIIGQVLRLFAPLM